MTHGAHPWALERSVCMQLHTAQGPDDNEQLFIQAALRKPKIEVPNNSASTVSIAWQLQNAADHYKIKTQNMTPCEPTRWFRLPAVVQNVKAERKTTSDCWFHLLLRTARFLLPRKPVIIFHSTITGGRGAWLDKRPDCNECVRCAKQRPSQQVINGGQQLFLKLIKMDLQLVNQIMMSLV